MKPRKPRHLLDEIAQANARARAALRELDGLVLESLALETPVRAVADALGTSHSSVTARYLTPGVKRHRWPKSSRPQVVPAPAGDTP